MLRSIVIEQSSNSFLEIRQELVVLLLSLLMFVIFNPVYLVEADEREYLGADMCEKCHHVQYRSWRERSHGKAFEALKAGKRIQVKQASGSDPVKDYTNDSGCVTCHTTGYGKPGGFVSFSKTPNRVNVQCESCHGAGSDYVEKVMRGKFSFAHAEVNELGHIGYTAHTHAHSDRGEQSKVTAEHQLSRATGTHGHHKEHDQTDKYGYTILGDPPPSAHRHHGKIFPLDPKTASYCTEACHNDKSPTYSVSGIQNFRATFTRQVKKGVHRRYGLMFIHW